MIELNDEMKLSDISNLSETEQCSFFSKYKDYLKNIYGERFVVEMYFFYIYKITNMQNGKSYIGRSIKPLHMAYSHYSALRGNYHINKNLQKDFNDYGEDAYVFEILCKTNDRNKEKEYQEKYKTYNPMFGYNENEQYWKAHNSKANRKENV